MAELPIPQQAIESAARALWEEQDDHMPWRKWDEVENGRKREYFIDSAVVALAAAFKALGIREERYKDTLGGRVRYRFASRFVTLDLPTSAAYKREKGAKKD